MAFYDDPSPGIPALTSAMNLPDIRLQQLDRAADPKQPSIWDKGHISDTLLSIGSGLLSSQNFGDGLAAAGRGILSQQQALRAQQLKSTTFGGPDNEFAITTDALGNKSVQRMPAFAAVNREKREAEFRLKTAQVPKDVADIRGRVVHAIGQLPPEQRSAAYADVLANPGYYGVDTTGMPNAWTDQYGTVAGAMGMNVNQAINQGRNDRLADDRINTNAARLAQGDVRLQQGAARIAQGEARVAQGSARLAQGSTRLQQGQARIDQAAQRLPTPPASVMRAGKSQYATPRSRTEFAALPSGTPFMAPDGQIRIKP